MIKQHSSIRIDRDTVTKITAPDLMRIEVEKSRRAYEIGNNCRLFRVPKILEYHEDEGVAVFERLDIQPVQTAVPWGRERLLLAKHLGTALAVIHRELVLPDQMKISLPEELSLNHDEVFIHGDLSISNVCVGSAWPPLVVLDWQMSPLYGGKSTFGTRYFDIFWFIGNLIYNPSVRFVFGNPALPVAKIFIESYFSEANIDYNHSEAANYAKKLFSIETPRVKNFIRGFSKGRSRLLFPFSEMSIKDTISSIEDNYCNIKTRG